MFPFIVFIIVCAIIAIANWPSKAERVEMRYRRRVEWRESFQNLKADFKKHFGKNSEIDPLTGQKRSA